ncbi:unnamed protein product [Soboliphyme baturini]|uniref:Thiamine transporter 2 n=1 Tax=Soboliphyme baturini TaxID=241478 RepID=A0A183IHN6_9BILA|nr:unnamed protein product [Soboliphyme baturini]
MHIQWSSSVLYTYGFVKEFRPVEPFLTPFLVTTSKNLTSEQLYSEVYPVWTYSYLVFLVLVLLLSDLLRHQPVIVCESVAYAATWLLLTWGHSVALMQLMEVMYGIATATEIAYYAYAYTKYDLSCYKRISSNCRGAVEAGKFCSYLLSQLIISFRWGSYILLNYISLASMFCAFIVALLLPPIHKKDIQNEEQQDAVETLSHWKCDAVANYYKQMFFSCRKIYSNAFILKWSLWWSLATCGFFQIGNYIQLLWQSQLAEGQELYNGLTETVSCFLGTVAVLCTQFINVAWDIYGDAILSVLSAVDCALLYVMSCSWTIALTYVFYVVYRILYKIMFTVAM